MCGKILEGENLSIENRVTFTLFPFQKCRRVFHKHLKFKINKMAGLLKYFKHTQKKYKLDTSTFPDPGGPLSRDILHSSVGITNTQLPICPKCIMKHQIKEIMRAMYFANTSIKFFWHC